MTWKWRVGNGLGSDLTPPGPLLEGEALCVLTGLRWGLKEILSNFAA